MDRIRYEDVTERKCEVRSVGLVDFVIDFGSAQEVVPFEDVDEDERLLIVPGQVLYLSTGYRTRYGQKSRFWRVGTSRFCEDGSAQSG